MSTAVDTPELLAEPPRLRPGPGLVWTLLLGVLFFAGVVFAATRLGDPQRFLDILDRVQPAWLFVALLLQAGTYVAAGAAWLVAVRRGGHPLPLLLLARTSLAKLAFDQLIPTGGVSGTAFLVHALRTRGIPGALAFAVLFVEWAGYTAGYVVAVGAATLVLAWRDAMHPAIWTVLGIFSVLMLGRVVGLVIARRLPHGKWPRWLTRFRVVDLVLREAAAAPRDVSTSPAVIAKSGAWHVAVYIFDAGTLLVCLYALGTPAHPLDVYAAFLIAMLAATVAVLPGGLGAFEATCVALLTSFGTPVEDALAATVLLRLLTYWLPMLPGIFLARKLVRPGRDRQAFGDAR